MTPHHTQKKKHSAAKLLPKREKEPEYMIQINDPKVLRKDILESLREVIIFMQGYEKFRKIQEEKVATITVLKEQIKEVESLIGHHLRKYLPVGKLKPMFKEEPKHLEAVPALSQPVEEEIPAPFPVQTYRQEKSATATLKPKGELEELESQLQDIEHQLQNIQ
ncbi:MAG TPA: hypothetical protein VJG49_00390 [Candidatus Nanoarchaeia archaeon]|nr:hypothetical protein [Candidatus Nanoarchaeia archaeon]